MKNRSVCSLSLIVFTILLNTQCITTPVGLTSSSTPVQEKKIIENYGPVQGSDRVWSVFGLWMIGRPDIDRAIQDALKQKGGDALINVTCYEKSAWFFFVSSHRVIVQGEAIRFEKGSGDSNSEGGKTRTKIKR
ncbi:MAG: hypothetical protein JXA07_00220 [Spirochaetes bacterium]|nr:hypothetical protein [Spirochaetota bacterium]